jgi:hypothetical protein
MNSLGFGELLLLPLIAFGAALPVLILVLSFLIYKRLGRIEDLLRQGRSTQ